MRAEIVRKDYANMDLEVGQEIEVLGFVFIAGSLRAVWRDDSGFIWEIPTLAIRMLPYVKAEAEAAA